MSTSEETPHSLSVRQAAFIGVGAMVGAESPSLLVESSSCAKLWVTANTTVATSAATTSPAISRDAFIRAPGREP